MKQLTPRDIDYGSEWMVDYLDRDDRRHYRRWEYPEAAKINRWLFSHEDSAVRVVHTPSLREKTLVQPVTESAVDEMLTKLVREHGSDEEIR